MISRSGTDIVITQPGEWILAVGVHRHGKLWQVEQVTDIVDDRRRKCRLRTVRLLWIVEMSWMGPDYALKHMRATWDQKQQWKRRYRQEKTPAKGQKAQG